ncbi:MAG TPA: phosphoribosylaminoimidazolesuccinocarboxamide synthase [Acidimicrobiales bacterium]|nr:phosphoribosylaminoimidazolesuccinocarboxamide synthase [Acidimicrobiales bacterium]
MTLELVYSGKVRDLYDAGDGLLLVVASDRISAYDFVFDKPVPDKGRVLTAMTVYWSGELCSLAPTHLVSADPARFPAETQDWPGLAGRGMLVRRAEMLPIECVVRGYLAGSAWREYRERGTMHGEPLAVGLVEACRLPEPVFTPSTKAVKGHDENISFAAAAALIGAELAGRVRQLCVAAYTRAGAIALGRGVIIADTKFELGLVDGELTICDEIITPDSSRLWDAAAWVSGLVPPAFDKQPMRDWAAATGWDMASPPPPLPAEVVASTRARYIDAYERVTGLRFADWWNDGGET